MEVYSVTDWLQLLAGAKLSAQGYLVLHQNILAIALIASRLLGSPVACMADINLAANTSKLLTKQ